MKKVLLLLTLTILLVGCAPAEVPVVEKQSTPDRNDENDDKAVSTSMPVPAPGHEDVPEMIVADSGTPSEDEPAEQPKIEAVREITMEAKKFEFVPSEITVNQGETVKLTVTSTDVNHGFAISEYGIREKLEPGVPVIIEFVADKAGEFNFFCSVPCGMGHGRMRGTLIVR